MELDFVNSKHYYTHKKVTHKLLSYEYIRLEVNR